MYHFNSSDDFLTVLFGHFQVVALLIKIWILIYHTLLQINVDNSDRI